LGKVQFEWDEAKKAGNWRKHGVRFEDAANIFGDRFVMSVPDTVHSELEDREVSLGMLRNGAVYVVVHTLRIHLGVEFIRIISARSADEDETVVYLQNRSFYEATL